MKFWVITNKKTSHFVEIMKNEVIDVDIETVKYMEYDKWDRNAGHIVKD